MKSFKCKRTFLDFLKWRKVSNKPICRAIQQHFYNTDWPYESSITDVNVRKSKNVYKVEITTHRPGLLIGKAGRYIDSLIEYLTDCFQKKVEIDIKECDLWNLKY